MTKIIIGGHDHLDFGANYLLSILNSKNLARVLVYHWTLAITTVAESKQYEVGYFLIYDLGTVWESPVTLV